MEDSERVELEDYRESDNSEKDNEESEFLFSQKLKHWMQENFENRPQDVVTILERFIDSKRGERVSLGAYKLRLSYLYDFSDSFTKYPLFRDLSEAYGNLGDYIKAAEFAKLAKRHDLEGDNLLFAHDFSNAAKAYAKYGVSSYQLRHKKLLYCFRFLLSATKIKTENQCKTKFKAIYSQLIEYFGTWETISLLMHNENFEQQILSSLPAAASQKTAVFKPLSELVCEIESIKMSFVTQADDEYQAEMAKLNNLLAKGDFVEAAESLQGRYLSSQNDLYFSILIAAGKDLTAEDIIENQYFYIERKGNLFQKLKSLYIAEVRKRLDDFLKEKKLGLLGYFLEVVSKPPTFNHFLKNGDPFIVYSFNTYEPYIKFMRDFIGDVELKIRKDLNLKESNEKWISEKALFEYVRNLVGELEVIRGATPAWLAGQHLDVFVPELCLAFEYMGNQHYKPVEIFGGQEAFIKGQERDDRKLQLCEANGVLCVHVKYDESWEMVEEIVVKHLRRKKHMNNSSNKSIQSKIDE